MKITITLCAALFLFACSQGDLISDQKVTQETLGKQDKETYVSLDQAANVAKAFFGKQSGETNLRSAKAPKSVSSVETVKDSIGNPLMYVINFKEGGFTIVGATRNYYPVLAYSDDNSFTLAPDMGAVSVWMGETEEAVKTSDALDELTKKKMRSLWQIYEMADSVPSSKTSFRSATAADTPYDAMMERKIELYNQYGPDGWYQFYTLSDVSSYFSTNMFTWDNLCNTANSVGSPPEYTIFAIKEDPRNKNVGPLLSTQWYQDSPFNELCPNHYKAGCVAIAMAQIMKFHKWPTSYNWSDMPNTGATISTQTLIRDIGSAVKMDYESFGSGANINNTVIAFRDSFNYNVTYAAYNSTQVSNEIYNNKRPVYMRGFTDKSGGGGHSWVCDGVREDDGYFYFVEYLLGSSGNYSYSNLGYTSAAYPGGISGPLNYLYFHMNWGEQSLNNGWFIGDDVNPGGGNFKELRDNLFVSPK